MATITWQKSSYCAQGEACVHISVTAETVLLSDSATPAPTSILTTGHGAFAGLIRMLRDRDDDRSAFPTTRA
ncbi:DUF397 domain-containing protein [Streptomyces sp. WI04-05B]|uniref:DUF397 domain-containing protein n=1 Tax=Streptomyces TaxID=1883 RepID=UPI0029B09756|nr:MULTISPECIES: DUF397 domain-containing protein [unclassified Streptomyces]MDX2546096.1 DUF397 domain-containing protein [Streptomyces sp. WI04-05B]MDX2587214.1 DUF397 domain-containing protein [Streptomyces sp. WI04-05A]MDX3752634.1 DUF397 domain-containing protein [Streptomyces sp. AK08-02]